MRYDSNHNRSPAEHWFLRVAGRARFSGLAALRLQGGRLALATAALGLLTCAGPERVVKNEPVQDLRRAEQLRQIREAYRPIPCFRTEFRVNVRSAGNSQSANGELRVDNQRQRMSFLFSHPLFGITLMRITIKDRIAHISNPHAEDPRQQRMRIPVEQFAVSGLGRNGITLPFRLFQDLLFARIPPDVFAPDADVRKTAPGTIEVALDSRRESYRYGFVANRLRTLEYVEKSAGNQVKVALNGQYGDSAFPETIEMQMNPAAENKKDQDSMTLRFRELNLKASCADRYFPSL